MLSYLSEVDSSLQSKKGGMEKNAPLWANLNVTVADLEQKINAIAAKNAEVQSAKQEFTRLSNEARKLCDEAWLLDEKVENLAKGIHAEQQEKLIEYNIKLKKSATTKEAPSKVLIPGLEDDTDGEGFIVSTSVDPLSDYYEWQKGLGANPADTKTIPELKNFKTTKKSSFVDDDVPKGVRVFYRVRAANRNGAGPWSEAVSRVQ